MRGERRTGERVAAPRTPPATPAGGGPPLDVKREADMAAPAPAVFLRDEDSEQAQVPHLLGPAVREFLALVEGMGLGDDVSFPKIPNRLARDLLRLREREVHVRRQKSFCRIKSPRAEP